MGPALGIGEQAASLATLAVGEGSVWVLDTEHLVLGIDPNDLGVSETLEGVAGASSDVGSGMAVGAGAIWITAPEAITRIILQSRERIEFYERRWNAGGSTNLRKYDARCRWH